MKKTCMLAAGIAATSLAGAALAGTAVIDGLGGPLMVNSREIPGVFGQGSPVFSNSVMAAIHNDLHADGINTDAVVTFLLLDTDHGLAFITLVDDNTQQGTGTALRTGLAMSSTAPDHTARFINDSDEDIQLFFDPPNRLKTAAGEFTWNADQSGDGFAWSQLLEGDFITFFFEDESPTFPTHPGLDEDDTFQFVNWTGSEWEIVAQRSFTNNGQFAFSFTVIPLPAPALMGIAGLALVAIARRRMSR